MFDYSKRQTVLSACREYRYALWRDINQRENPRYVVFIGLNPSTADESVDDPTIRRCWRFAEELGFGALCMANLFAYRATKPKDLFQAGDPVGPENDQYLLDLTGNAEMAIAAWGVHGSFLKRDVSVKKLVRKLHCLKETKHGHPAHPLYLRADLRPVLYFAQNEMPL